MKFSGLTQEEFDAYPLPTLETFEFEDEEGKSYMDDWAERATPDTWYEEACKLGYKGKK